MCINTRSCLDIAIVRGSGHDHRGSSREKNPFSPRQRCKNPPFRTLTSEGRHKTLLLLAPSSLYAPAPRRPPVSPPPFPSGSIIDLSYLPGNQTAAFDQFIFPLPPSLPLPLAIPSSTKGAMGRHGASVRCPEPSSTAALFRNKKERVVETGVAMVLT